MRKLFPLAMTITFIFGASCAVKAQSAPTNTASPQLVASAEPGAHSGADVNKTGSGTAAQPDLQSTVTQEIEALKARIEQLETEVKEDHERALADSADTAALKAAEKELVAGNGGAIQNPARPAAGTSSSLQTAAPAAPAEPAAPEISAQTTTKGEPFPGDW